MFPFKKREGGNNARRLEVIEGPTDEELLQRYVEGDKSAFEAIVARYRDRLLRYAHSIVRNREEAEDLVQLAFMKLLEEAETVTGAALNGWLYSVVRNRGYNIGRDTKRRHDIRFANKAELMPKGSTGLEDPETEALSTEEREHLQEVIDTLLTKHAEVLRLRFMEDLSYEEIAERLGVPKGTVMSRLKRAKEALRVELEKRGLGPEPETRAAGE